MSTLNDACEKKTTESFYVDGCERDCRIDKYLAQYYNDQFSRSQIQQAIEKGAVSINQKVNLSKRQPVCPGDYISFTFPQTRGPQIKAVASPIEIIFEDEHLIVVNKPAGQVVHPGNGTGEDTLVHALLAHCSLSLASGQLRPGVVHRLDQATSGLVIFAKEDVCYFRLTQLFAKRKINKLYHALVHGIPSLQSGTIEANLGRAPHDRTAMCIRSNGRHALTHWFIKEQFAKEDKSLLGCEPRTGRTHQLRVHLKHIGHPIVGDLRYGKEVAGDLRMMLHAYKLEFTHPITHQLIHLQAEWPKRFQEEIEKLRLSAKNDAT